ncbi:hypothetical protein EYF80_044357 [Liparis tanakae]|uniref:Uncharacterized protein n=1 Tax=Liparis tanakae TaxID=230148 RepID=A0A4Z2FYM6_9TELE|nr:hypothetical protein EYF80_044357 [Liparis tanakae]
MLTDITDFIGIHPPGTTNVHGKMLRPISRLFTKKSKMSAPLVAPEERVTLSCRLQPGRRAVPLSDVYSSTQISSS